MRLRTGLCAPHPGSRLRLWRSGTAGVWPFQRGHRARAVPRPRRRLAARRLLTCGLGPRRLQPACPQCPSSEPGEVGAQRRGRLGLGAGAVGTRGGGTCAHRALRAEAASPRRSGGFRALRCCLRRGWGTRRTQTGPPLIVLIQFTLRNITSSEISFQKRNTVCVGKNPTTDVLFQDS